MRVKCRNLRAQPCYNLYDQAQHDASHESGEAADVAEQDRSDDLLAECGDFPDDPVLSAKSSSRSSSTRRRICAGPEKWV
jgi:hypothetical protein